MAEENTEKFSEQLKEIKGYLDDMDFESKIIGKSPLPVDVLLTALPLDYKERNRYINFSFVPLTDDDLEYIDLLQFYTTLPIQLSGKTNRNLVENAIGLINSRTAVGHFGLHGDGEIYLRYIYSTHKVYGINEEQFAEILFLYIMQLDMYEEVLDKAVNGEVTVEQLALFFDDLERE